MIKAFAQVFLLLILPSIVQGQEIQHEKKKRLQGVYMAPSAGFEFFSLTKYNTNNNGYSITYKALPSYRLGLDLFFKQSDKFLINGSLFYSRKAYDRTEVCEECATDYYYQSKYVYNYLEMAGGLTYNFVTGRFDVGVYTNMNVAVLLGAKETRATEAGNSFVFNLKPFSNKTIAIVEPGLNFNYNLSYRLSLGVKTGYRLYTNSIENAKTFRNNAVLVQPGLVYMF